MFQRALEKVRVLDVSHVIAGPFCTMILANAGAEVIKIERPGTGERSRKSGHVLANDANEPMTLQYVRVNRGKRGVTLDLKAEEGRELFRRLIAVSDVLVENFSPGTMDKLGLGYEALRAINPRLIYATISGYGRRDDLEGPYSAWPANNPAAQAMSGLMDVTGEPGGPPSLVGSSIGDTVPGLWTAYAIALALMQRQLNGEGQHIDISMYDCMVMHNDVSLAYYNAFGKISGRDRADMFSPQIRLEAADGYVVISGVVSKDRWRSLWQKAGRDDLAGNPEYLGKIDGPFLLGEVKPKLEAWTRTQSKADLCRLLIDLDFSAAIVQNAREVFDCPHLEARHMFHEFDFAGRHFRFAGDPIKLSHTEEANSRPPPYLGEHSGEVLGRLLGLTGQEIENYRAKGVI